VSVIRFEKYQGTGNDFVMIHTNNWNLNLSNDSIVKLCNRRFGIGSDGLIIVGPHAELDFEMRYFNADGSRSFCGNGARCAVKFAQSLGLFDKECRFLAIDGEHQAQVLENGFVSLKMGDVKHFEINKKEDFILNTGSPHYIRFVDDLDQHNIVDFGKEIRYSTTYQEEGINVNLAEVKDEELKMLTYERGVEDETLSCGTGATAVGLAFRKKLKMKNEVETKIYVKGGELRVRSNENEDGFFAIFLIGPAEKVFEGKIEVD
jgi:diaminopimelate epimerase